MTDLKIASPSGETTIKLEGSGRLGTVAPKTQLHIREMTDIEKTEAEIKVLQKKLELLKEIETHKSQPRMEFDFGGKFEIVSYNKKSYYRFEFPDEVYWYKRTSHETYLDLKLERITDGETHRLLEGLWFNDVRKGNYV
jgi:hypothetical protein